MRPEKVKCLQCHGLKWNDGQAICDNCDKANQLAWYDDQYDGDDRSCPELEYDDDEWGDGE